MGDAFRNTVQEINDIVADAEQKLGRKYEQTIIDVNRFSNSTTLLGDSWYEGGDIFGSNLMRLIVLLIRY